MRFVGAMLFGVFVFIGLPLLGWGVYDMHGFFHHPARLLYCVFTLVLQALSVIVLPQAGLGAGQGKKLVHRQRIALLLVQILTTAMFVAAPHGDRWVFATLPDSNLCRYAGLALFTVAFLFVTWATACLGKQFSIQVTVQEDHKLITNGAYRVVRHPRYLGILVCFIGFALVFRSWLALVLVVPLALVLVWRIYDEEGLMHQEFPSEWDAYARRTSRLVPFLY